MPGINFGKKKRWYLENGASIVDPGDGELLSPYGSDEFVDLTTSGAETRVMQAASLRPKGFIFKVYLETVTNNGTVTFTGVNDRYGNELVLNAQGQGAVIEVVDDGLGSKKWEAVSGYNANVAESIPLTAFRTHDNLAVNLPATASNDDMGLDSGSPGSTAPSLRGVDFGGGATDEAAAMLYTIPQDYVAGTDLIVRIHAGMITTISDDTALLVLFVHKLGAGVSASNIVQESAQDINDLTLADINFTLDGTGLLPGGILYLQVIFNGEDTTSAGVMIPVITDATILRTAIR